MGSLTLDMLGRRLYRWRWVVFAAWVLTAALLVWLVPQPPPGAGEQATFLPSDAPDYQAISALKKAFPTNSGISRAVIVFERRPAPDDNGALREQDFETIERVAGAIRKPSPPGVALQMLEGLAFQSPGMFPVPENPLVSRVGPNGQAAIVLVEVPANFITIRSSVIVDHIYAVLQHMHMPPGLGVSVTGTSGLGHDYAAAAERSHQRTFRVTLVAVLAILLLVYRAPLAALVPLMSVSLAAMVAWKLLAAGFDLGLRVGTAEKIFVLVLLYGAGVDYSLLVISRYREMLDDGKSTPDAIGGAWAASFGAIVASAMTNIAALLMLCFAKYGIFRSTGPAVGVALTVALLAAITLVPALTAMLGKNTFWPARHVGQVGKRLVWPRVANLVASRPGLVMIATVAVLALPALRGVWLPWSYDTAGSLEPGFVGTIGNGAEGLAVVKRHWPAGEISPVTAMIAAPEPLDADRWRRLASELTSVLGNIRTDGGCPVHNVRSLTQPLGRGSAKLDDPMMSLLTGPLVSRQYLSKDMTAMRIDVVLNCPAFSSRAMASVAAIRDALQLAIAPLTGARLYISGATAEMIDIRQATTRDFRLVAALALGVILLVIVVLMRDILLAVFMVASTVLSYLATLGITYWFFHTFMGVPGLDWKVEVFLFVIMVAVGQDYNIFLAARLLQETRRLDHRRPVEAVRLALVHTGPVISSCGVIMAATLGSLMAGELALLKQLGFAMGLGMLVDTFIVRPLLLPAFAVLTGKPRCPAARKEDATP